MRMRIPDLPEQWYRAHKVWTKAKKNQCGSEIVAQCKAATDAIVLNWHDALTEQVFGYMMDPLEIHRQ